MSYLIQEENDKLKKENKKLKEQIKYLEDGTAYKTLLKRYDQMHEEYYKLRRRNGFTMSDTMNSILEGMGIPKNGKSYDILDLCDQRIENLKKYVKRIENYKETECNICMDKIADKKLYCGCTINYCSDCCFKIGYYCSACKNYIYNYDF